MGNGGLAFHVVASHSLPLAYLTEVAGDADTNGSPKCRARINAVYSPCERVQYV
jgi:hypothetical protein